MANPSSTVRSPRFSTFRRPGSDGRAAGATPDSEGAAGGLAGAYLLDLFFRSGNIPYPANAWIFLLGAAVVGALLMTFVFRWALIILSSLAGAQLITQSLSLSPEWTTVAVGVLTIVGVVIQGRNDSRPG